MSKKPTQVDLERQKLRDERDEQEEIFNMSRRAAHFAKLNDDKIGPIWLHVPTPLATADASFVYLQAPFVLHKDQLRDVIQLLRMRRQGVTETDGLGSLPATKMISDHVANYLASVVSRKLEMDGVTNMIGVDVSPGFSFAEFESRVRKFPEMVNEYVRTGTGYYDMDAVINLCAGRKDLYISDPFLEPGRVYHWTSDDFPAEPRITSVLPHLPSEREIGFAASMVFSIMSIGFYLFSKKVLDDPLYKFSRQRNKVNHLLSLVETTPDRMKEVVTLIRARNLDTIDPREEPPKAEDVVRIVSSEESVASAQTPIMKIVESKDTVRKREARKAAREAVKKENDAMYGAMAPKVLRRAGAGRKAKVQFVEASPAPVREASLVSVDPFEEEQVVETDDFDWKE